ncbi:SGNH/GDSL hydrolase family protein [Herbihabitans rhizosphaerae]|uniref:SGNH/GDSL hydrolase family protein n=1 Tax=Herbihabitans rhizosphaerae TaxID=1872711 RepID=UPI001F5FACF1|nr:SGNH/GDSL hydrolase family protein [Herbihabitans rhizosphaerae]
MGDSTTVGLGDPLPGGGWRGYGPLLAEALSATDLHNLSFTGARAADVRWRQLPRALEARPDVVTIVVGMNDTLRSDFDARQMHDDLDAVVGTLTAAGAVVLLVRFHDHAQVFRLPGPLRRALRGRIEALNEVVSSVASGHDRAAVLDLDTMPGAYDVAAWSVDRLHPSELGHRILASGFAALLDEFGCVVPNPVSMVCSGGANPGPIQHVAWLLIKGLPWLARRGRDLLPYAMVIIVRSLLGMEHSRPPATVERIRAAG